MAARGLAQEPISHQAVQSLEALAHIGRTDRKITPVQDKVSKKMIG